MFFWIDHPAAPPPPPTQLSRSGIRLEWITSVQMVSKAVGYSALSTAPRTTLLVVIELENTISSEFSFFLKMLTCVSKILTHCLSFKWYIPSLFSKRPSVKTAYSRSRATLRVRWMQPVTQKKKKHTLGHCRWRVKDTFKIFALCIQCSLKTAHISNVYC